MTFSPLRMFSHRSRQTLPIQIGASRYQRVALCLHQWSNWHEHMTVIELRESMRTESLIEGQSPEKIARMRAWAAWLRRLGDGDPSLYVSEVDDGIGDIRLWPSQCYAIDSPEAVDTMLANIYDCPCEQMLQQPTEWWSSRAIVTPLHTNVSYINDRMLDQLPGTAKTFRSRDGICEGERYSGMITPEFFKKYSPKGLPEGELRLKPGAIIMLLRNLKRSTGLANGTRLRVDETDPRSRFLACTVLTGKQRGTQVLLPRIKLKCANKNLPFEWYRIQFPVRLAYAMTINKSQGQTLYRLAILLARITVSANGETQVEESATFDHGQLTVAMSRSGDPDNVFIYLDPIRYAAKTTAIQVFREALLSNARPTCELQRVRNVALESDNPDMWLSEQARLAWQVLGQRDVQLFLEDDPNLWLATQKLEAWATNGDRQCPRQPMCDPVGYTGGKEEWPQLEDIRHLQRMPADTIPSEAVWHEDGFETAMGVRQWHDSWLVAANEDPYNSSAALLEHNYDHYEQIESRRVQAEYELAAEMDAMAIESGMAAEQYEEQQHAIIAEMLADNITIDEAVQLIGTDDVEDSVINGEAYEALREQTEPENLSATEMHGLDSNLLYLQTIDDIFANSNAADELLEQLEM